MAKSSYVFHNKCVHDKNFFHLNNILSWSDCQVQQCSSNNDTIFLDSLISEDTFRFEEWIVCLIKEYETNLVPNVYEIVLYVVSVIVTNTN